MIRGASPLLLTIAIGVATLDVILTAPALVGFAVAAGSALAWSAWLDHNKEACR